MGACIIHHGKSKDFQKEDLIITKENKSYSTFFTDILTLTLELQKLKVPKVI
jgi:hypothetical protein